MLRSKNIADYFEAKLKELRADRELLCPIHLYFERNEHLIVWKKAGDTLSEEWINSYASRGLEKIFIHRADEELWRRYLAGEIAPDAASPSDSAKTPNASETGAGAGAGGKKTGPQTAEGAVISAAMKSKALNETERETLIAETARGMLAEAHLAGTTEQQKEIEKKHRNVIKDILEDVGGEAVNIISDFLKLANIDPELEHAINVSTYTTIFAMAFGKVKPDLLGDLALAGLLHDLGISQVSASVTSLPWRALTPDQLKRYSQHVELGVALIQAHAPTMPPRVIAIMRQHHEKFDGSGYPRKLEGFALDDVSQMVAIADMVDSIASGQWDGLKRTMAETFQTLERLERAKTFPEYFNPEIFGSVIRWLRMTKNQVAMESVVATVTKQAKSVVGGGDEKP